MTIQSSTAQNYYRAAMYRPQSSYISNPSGTIPNQFQHNFDNYSNSLRNPGAGNSSNPMPNAPQNVKEAWASAVEEVGRESLGMSPDGKLSFISSYTMAQLEQRFQTGSGDMFGSSVDSAITGAQKILDRLNNPLSPPHNGEIAKLQENEKLFYQQFIQNLTKAQSSQTVNGTSPAAFYEQMTGRTVSSGEPSYNLSQEQIDDLKSRYDIENITAEEYKSLVKEMAEMGVVSKSEAASGYTRRPIITGIFESDIFEQKFTYDSFEEGNFVEWAENLAAKYDSGMTWILNSKNNLNDAKTNKENIESLQKSSDSVRRMLQVLNQLK